MRSLAPLFELLTKTEAQDLAKAAAGNAQVWVARRCGDDHLPAFMQIHRGNIKGKTLRALEYKIQNRKRYGPSA